MRAFKKYLDNLTDELYTANFFHKMRKGVRKVGLLALLTATIGIGGYLTGARGEEATEPLYQSKIAFMSERDGDKEIYVMNADGSEQKRLTNIPKNDIFPFWSPDGKKIAFISDRDRNEEIYVMNADGNEQTRLTNNPAFDWEPRWSPDSKKIAFKSNRDGKPQIYVMKADGSGLRNLTNVHLYFIPFSGEVPLSWVAFGEESPSWSPDGEKIAFESWRDGNLEIYVMKADGSGQRNLTKNPAVDLEPRWSPDGKKIAFTSYRDGNGEIYVMDSNGSNLKRLTNNPASDGFPVWSPDGKKIAFVSKRDENLEIYVMNADGSEQKNLTNNPASDVYPSWSPFLETEK